MFEFVQLGILAVCAAVSFGALASLVLAIWCVSRLPPTRHDPSVPVPATTVLKPLCGDEPRLREALLSFCRQDFPAPLQIIFGVRSPADSALPLAHELKAQHPHLDIEIVVDPRVYGPNFKASNVINMMRLAKHDVIVVSDSSASSAEQTRIAAPSRRATTIAGSENTFGPVSMS